MRTIKLSQVMQANRWLRRRRAEAKREREQQQRLGQMLMQFVIDEFPAFVEEYNKVVKSSNNEQR